jgi:hypothetical protein
VKNLPKDPTSKLDAMRKSINLEEKSEISFAMTADKT